MKKNLKKGFTLTELVVVIVIIGILASVLIPTLTSYITRSRKSAAEQEANALLQEAAAYVLDHDNEEWFAWNEYMKSSKVEVATSNGYFVIFENGKLNTSATADESSVSGDNFAKLVYDKTAKTYTLTVTGNNAKLKTAFTSLGASGGTITITVADPVTVAAAA